MGLRINTNIASLVDQRHLGRATTQVNASLERLATGRRIVRASDDPAGAAMAARMQAQIRSLSKARRNAEDGISMIQIAEGGLAEIGNALDRARELAVQARNGTLSQSDRDSLQTEFAAIQDTVRQIAFSTVFNGLSLLNDSTPNVTLQVGPFTVPDIDTLDVSLVSATLPDLGLAGTRIDNAADASVAIAALDGAIDLVARGRSQLGASHNGLEARIANLDTQLENLQAAHSRIMDVDVAVETANLMKARILQQSALSVLGIANHLPEAALQLLDSIRTLR
jgi:flagellin